MVFRFFNLLLALFIFSSSIAAETYAVMNYTELKGLDGILKPEYEYLSPIYGLTLIETHVLENKRLRDIQLLEGNKNSTSSTQTYPDRTSFLLKKLFPSKHGSLKVADSKLDLISFFNPKQIGILLGWMAQITDDQLIELPAAGAGNKRKSPEGKKDQLINELTALLIQNVKPEMKAGLESSIKNDDCLTCDTQLGSRPLDHHKIDSMEKYAEALISVTNNGPNSPQNNPKKEKDIFKDEYFKDLAKLIIEVLRESRVPPHIYPKHFPEQMLLAFFWSKAGGQSEIVQRKSEFIHLIDGINSVIKAGGVLKNPNLFLNPESRSHFLSSYYTKSDFEKPELKPIPKNQNDPYNNHYKEQNLKNVSNILKEQPGLYVANSIYAKLLDSKMPKILQTKTVMSPDRDSSKDYNDCVEMSVLNFFNILSYNPDTQNFELDNLTHNRKVSPSSELTSYYPSHQSFSFQNEDFARKNWDHEKLSGITGIGYAKKSHDHVSKNDIEIEPHPENIVHLIEHLLFAGNPELLKNNPIQKASTVKSKVDALCEVLSREGYKLTWKLTDFEYKSEIEDKNEINHRTQGRIAFSVNDQPAFQLAFHPLHAEVVSMQKYATKNAQFEDEELSKTLLKSDNKIDPSLVNWFVNDKNITHFAKNNLLDASIMKPLAYGISIPNSTTDRDELIKSVHESHITSLNPLLERLNSPTLKTMSTSPKENPLSSP